MITPTWGDTVQNNDKRAAKQIEIYSKIIHKKHSDRKTD